MVANGLLTNPTLFTGTNYTTLECVQQWTDICYNSTLDLNKFQKLSKNKTLTATIPEKPSNLTFQCFHHHLVFMLEKLLPRRKRQIFNNLQKFSDTLVFLENEFNIVPNLFNVSDYFKTCSTVTKYEDLEEVYRTLKTEFMTEDECCWYDYNKKPGNFFENRVAKTGDVDYDLVSLFIENG